MFKAKRLLLILFAVLIFASLPMAAFAQDGETGSILVWKEAGESALRSSPSAAGELGYFSLAGEFTPLQEVPAQTSRVIACGETATAPNGSLFAYYIGLDSGDLFVLPKDGQPARLDGVNALSCLGNGTFQYSPDSTRLAYIAYESDATASEFADGFLKVFETNGLSQVFRAENVTAFDLGNNGAAYVSFYTNSKNEADEAAVFWWDGSTERELATLTPDESCKYTSASIGVQPDNNLMLIMGHRCTTGDTRTSWQLYTVNTETRGTTLAASDFQAGAFTPYARTNNIIFSADASTALFTVPDGITANTVSLVAVDLATLTPQTLVERQVVMPTFSGMSNAAPVLSLDGSWLAVVATTPNNENTLHIFDLTNPSLAPITYSAGSRNDVISAMAFTPDNRRLVFIAGSADTGRNSNNSLIAIDLASGSDLRIRRGRFASGLALSPSGNSVVAMDYQVVDDERQPPYLNLVNINIDTSEVNLIFEGAEVVDGQVTDQHFALPLSWR